MIRLGICAVLLAGCTGQAPVEAASTRPDVCGEGGAKWNRDAKRCEAVIDGKMWVTVPGQQLYYSVGGQCPQGYATNQDWSGYCVPPEAIARYAASKPAQYAQPYRADPIQEAQLRALREIAEQQRMSRSYDPD